MIRALGVWVFGVSAAGCAPWAGGQDVLPRIDEFIGVVSLPAMVIEDWNENGVWPELRRVNQMLNDAAIDMELCRLSVDELAVDGFRIEYSLRDEAQDSCRRSFLALAQRSFDDAKCFNYLVSLVDTTPPDSNGRIFVAGDCGSSDKEVRLDLSDYVSQRPAAGETAEKAADRAANALRQRLRERLSDSQE